MTPKAQKVVFLLVLVFIFLHHDFWLWEDKRLVFGFLPSGLAWHIGYSLATALFWYLVMKFAWPQAVEDFAEGKSENMNEPSSQNNSSEGDK